LSGKKEELPRHLSERVLNRYIKEVAAPARSGFLDEIVGEEMAVARIGKEVTPEGVGRVEIGLRAYIPSRRRVPRS
jgi:hypothetical protein